MSNQIKVTSSDQELTKGDIVVSVVIRRLVTDGKEYVPIVVELHGEKNNRCVLHDCEPVGNGDYLPQLLFRLYPAMYRLWCGAGGSARIWLNVVGEESDWRQNRA
jgi:hypothetical protein